MQKTYTVELSTEGLNRIQKILNTMEKLFQDEKFLKFIGEKSLQALNTISLQKLTTVSKDNIDSSNYMQHHHLEINEDNIRLYNDSVIDISSKDMSENKKQYYQNPLSLAKIVEYGIGYTGSIKTNQEDVEDWEYDIGLNKDGSRGHGYKGWYYKDDNGNYVWTNGFEGRLIFSSLRKHILDNAGNWIKEYLEKNIKD